MRTEPSQPVPAGGRTPAWLRPITGFGWSVIAVVLVAIPLGLVTGWSEWWGLGIAGLVLLVLAVAQSFGSFAYRMDLGVAERRVAVGDPGRIDVRVINAARRRQWPVIMEVAVADTVTTAVVPALPAGAFADIVLPVPTQQRAILQVGPVRMVRGDVLRIVRREVTWPLAEQVYVHPRTVRTDGALAGYVRDLDGEESTVRTSSDLSFHALREYVPGDDRRHIHWKKTATAGSLLVREFLETRRSLVVLALSTDPNDYHDTEEFELAVSSAASVMVGLLRTGRTVVTTAGSAVIRGREAGAVLDQFSGIAADERGNLLAATRLAARRFPQLSLLVPVYGSTVSGGTSRAAHQLRPGGSAVLGLRMRTTTDGHGAGGVAGDTLTVGALESLPVLLRGARR